MIAERLVAHRRGRTTIVTTVSPLLLHHADRVALLVGERVTAYGTHEELLHSQRRVSGPWWPRAMDEDVE